MKIIAAYRTARDTGERLSPIEGGEFSSSLPVGETITLDPGTAFQEMLGFGGAFTEAAAVTLSRVSEELRREALESYFDPQKGLGYNLGRVHVHSCDFALGSYTYVEEGDEELSSFSVEHDRKLILPLIKDAFEAAGAPLTLLASPWSPPAWMKTNGDMKHGGKLLPRYRQTWADYFVKFIEAYRAEGVPLWGVTVQNEPDAVQIWDSCLYSAEEERDFVKEFLGPALEMAGLEDTRILIWDHNRDLIVERARTVLEDPEAAKYIWGTGFHWYVSEEFENVGKVHDLFPDKHLLFTEGCQEGGCRVGAWFTGERYGRNMIGDFNNWCEGYLDWNLVLDETGGPNHVGNLCDAPIIADTKNNRLIYNSSYYYIGHFSKFIRPGARRIKSVSSLSEIAAAAFLNPDNTLVLVVMNEGDSSRDFSVECTGECLPVSLPPHSIATFLM